MPNSRKLYYIITTKWKTINNKKISITAKSTKKNR